LPQILRYPVTVIGADRFQKRSAACADNSHWHSCREGSRRRSSLKPGDFGIRVRRLPNDRGVPFWRAPNAASGFEDRAGGTQVLHLFFTKQSPHSASARSAPCAAPTVAHSPSALAPYARAADGAASLSPCCVRRHKRGGFKHIRMRCPCAASLPACRVSSRKSSVSLAGNALFPRVFQPP
jgi:hypothetical protein